MSRSLFAPQSKKKTSDDGTLSGSSNDSKEKPLLVTIPDVEMQRESKAVDRMKNRKKKYLKAKDDRGGTLCGCLGHITILFLPLIAMASMLALLIVLLVFDRSNIQEIQFNGEEQYQDIAEAYYSSVSSDTISLVMSLYQPYPVVLALASVSCVLVSMVTVARNIQIEVYHKRTRSIIFMKFINYLAAIINILSYAGLMVAVNFKVNQEEPEYAVTAHFIGFVTFFGGSAAYAVLHSFLIWNQAEYPRPVKALFFVQAALIAGASLAFGIPIWQGGLSSDEGADSVWEWVAVFASAINIGTYVILFFIDPVDDELSFFFCGTPRPYVRMRGSIRPRRSNIKQQKETQQIKQFKSMQQVQQMKQMQQMQQIKQMQQIQHMQQLKQMQQIETDSDNESYAI